MRHKLLRTALVALSLTACENSGENLTIPGYIQGAVVVRFRIDTDNNGDMSITDTPVPGVKVAIFSASGTDTLYTGTTDAEGQIDIRNIPLGSYRLSIRNSTIGDSLRISDGDTTTIRLLARLDSLAISRNILLNYPEVTTAQARSLPPGRRVLLLGKVSAVPQNFHLGDAFVFDTAGGIRITNASIPAGQAALAVGDSVRVVGNVGTDRGQVVLTGGRLTLLASKIAPTVRVTTVTEARTAKGGTLDAVLVQVSGVKISDTTVVSPDFHVTVANALDPNDKITVVIDQFFDVVHALYKPGNNIVVRGVLVPAGDGTWVIRPRSAADITFPL